MKLEGTYTFEAPRDVVWNALLDPVLLGAILPGCEGLEPLGDDKYKAVLKVQIGPIQGVFEGTVALSDINKPDSYRMEVNGKGAPGFVKGGGDVRLEVQDGKTLMHYQGDAQVGGRIASVGHRLLESSAKALTQQSLDAIAQQIQARMAAQKASDGHSQVPLPAVKPPSQLGFALGVARGVLADLIPAKYRLLVLGGTVAVIVLLIILLASALGR